MFLMGNRVLNRLVKVDIYPRFNMKAQRVDGERGRQPGDRDLVDRRLSAWLLPNANQSSPGVRPARQLGGRLGAKNNQIELLLGSSLPHSPGVHVGGGPGRP